MAAKSKPLDQRRPVKKTAPQPDTVNITPTKFSYALKAHTAERRANGWHVTATPLADAKPEWSGPYATIESACLAIARRLAVEVADRHTRSIEFHKIDKTHPLYGLKPTTRIDA